MVLLTKEYYTSNMTEIFADDVCSAYLRAGADGKPIAVGFVGKRNSKAFHYYFKSADELYAYVNKWREGIIASTKARAEAKTARKKEQAEYRHTYKEGDILHSSWGFEQTQCEFYQVISTTEKTITIQRIASERLEATSWASEYRTALPNQFLKDYEPTTHKVKVGGTIKFSSYQNANLWDGNKKYCSWYA